jgi:hypothetical protein
VRRWFGLALVCLGGFLLTAAALVRWYAAPLAAWLPLEPDLSVTMAGAGRVYDVAAGGPVAGRLRETVTVRQASSVRSARVAVWDIERRLTRADGTLTALTRERVAVDRRTALAVPCCAEQPRHEGLGYAFPAWLPRVDVRIFDLAAGRAAPARYAGPERLGGLPVYRFEQEVPETGVGIRPLPGAPPLGAAPLGVPSLGVRSLPVRGGPVQGGAAAAGAAGRGRELVSARRTIWVEPVSGVPIRIEEHRRARLVRPGRGAVLLLDADLATDARSAGRLAGLAKARRAWLVGLRDVAPPAALGSGLVLLVAGIGYRIVTPTRSRCAEGSPVSSPSADSLT